MTNLASAIVLIISTIFLICMKGYLKKSKSNKKIVKLFSLVFGTMIIWNTSIVLQCLLSDRLNINPIIFEYFAYSGVVFLPVFLYFTSQVFSKPKFRIKTYHMLLFFIPILSLLILWTNDFHNLFYIKYSIYMDKTITGEYFNIYIIYTYSLLLISIVTLLKYSLKQSKKISVQSILFLLSIAIPVIINIAGMMNLVELTIYATPISFTLTIILLFIAIFKFDFMNINTIAFQTIVNTLSDSYLVLNDENMIVSCNNSFLTTFKYEKENLINKSIFSINLDDISIDDLKLLLDLVKTNNSKITIDKHFEKIDKYFSIELSPMLKDNLYVGTLIFFKDVTQKEHDKLQIKANQELLIEQERLASLRSNDWWYCTQPKNSYIFNIWWIRRTVRFNKRI